MSKRDKWLEILRRKPKAKMDWRRGSGYYDEMDIDSWLKEVFDFVEEVLPPIVYDINIMEHYLTGDTIIYQ